MSVKIRLKLEGRHLDPFYRIVVADHRFARDGRYIEQLGYFDPKKSFKEAKVDEVAAIKWINLGAQYSDTLKAIFKEKGILAKAKEAKANNPKPHKAKVVSTKSKKGE